MWFYIISSIGGLVLSQPFDTSIDCYGELTKALDERPALYLSDGLHKAAATGICIESGNWQRRKIDE